MEFTPLYETYVINYLGGALGGTTDTTSHHPVGTQIRVPVMVQRTGVVGDGTNPYSSDLYQFESRKYLPNAVVELTYRYVRPDVEGLRRRAEKAEAYANELAEAVSLYDEAKTLLLDTLHGKN